MVFANEKIFLTPETISPGHQKMVSGFETVVFVSHTKDSDAKTTVPETKAIVEDTKTMVEDDH